MMLFPGCNEASGRNIRLARSLHRLKQVGRCWHSSLVRQFEGFGPEQCPADPCNLRIIGKDGRIIIMLGVHIDHMIVAGSSAGRDRLHKHLNERFSTNDLRDLILHRLQFSS